jgi:hypothetical protein
LLTSSKLRYNILHYLFIKNCYTPIHSLATTHYIDNNIIPIICGVYTYCYILLCIQVDNNNAWATCCPNRTNTIGRLWVSNHHPRVRSPPHFFPNSLPASYCAAFFYSYPYTQRISLCACII